MSLLDGLLIQDFIVSAVKEAVPVAQKVIETSAAKSPSPVNQDSISQKTQNSYQNRSNSIVDAALQQSRREFHNIEALQKKASVIHGSFSNFKPWAPQGETCHTQAYYEKQKAADKAKIKDSDLVDKAMTMAEKADDWGVGLKVDNPFHYLMAKQGRFSEIEIKGAYRIVTDVRSRLFQRIQENEAYLGRPLSPDEKLKLIYDIIEREMGYQYQPTDHFMDGLIRGKLDCDTESYIVLAVAHEMGWPVKGVLAPRHFFVRWDDGEGTRFNMDLHGNSLSDWEYIGKFYGVDQRIAPDSITNGTYLKNLTREELIGNFLAIEGNNLDELNEATQLSPTNIIAWANLGDYYIKEGNLESGLLAYMHAEMMDPNDIDIPLFLGIENYKSGNLEDAQKDFDEAYRRMPKTETEKADVDFPKNDISEMEIIAQQCLDQGLKVLQERGQTWAIEDLSRVSSLLAIIPAPSAEKVFENFLETHRRDPEAQKYLSSLCSAFKMGGVFEKFLVKIHAQDPKNLFALQELGRLYNNEKKYDQARPLLEQAVAENPDNAWAQFTLGNVCENLKDYEAAKNAYQAASWIEPYNPTIQTRLGWAQSGLREFSAARESFLIAHDLDPLSKEPLLGLAKVDFILNKPEAIKRHCELILGLDPNNKEAQEFLGWAAIELKDYQGARNIFESLHKIDPQEKNYLLGLASAESYLKNYEKAKSYYFEIIDKDPSDRNARVGLGLVYIEEGKVDLANDLFQTILMENYQKRTRETLEPSLYTYEDAGALYGLGKICAKNGDFKKARYYLETAARLRPYDREIKEELQKVKAKIHLSKS